MLLVCWPLRWFRIQIKQSVGRLLCVRTIIFRKELFLDLDNWRDESTRSNSKVKVRLRVRVTPVTASNIPSTNGHCANHLIAAAWFPAANECTNENKIEIKFQTWTAENHWCVVVGEKRPDAPKHAWICTIWGGGPFLKRSTRAVVVSPPPRPLTC